jgi:Fe-S cluster assembly ATP-binding protein
MSNIVLNVNNLQASVEDTEILKGVDLEIKGGEIHAIMGPNGTGKSTLSSVIMGHPKFSVTNGTVTLNGEDVLDMEVDERARAGLFLAMQYPSEVSGVTNADFLRTAINARLDAEEEIGLFKFITKLDKAVEELEMNEDLPHRYLNEGFSGGEKKRNEILQMKLLQPKIAILDEIDSGLDVDALRIVGRNVSEMAKERGDEMGVLLITHYQRLLDYIQPDHVHVMMKGRIVRSGGPELARKVEEEGYDWLKAELGITDERVVIPEEKEVVRMNTQSIGVCATAEATKGQ